MEITSVSLKNFSSLRIGGEGNLCTVYSLSELSEVVMHTKREGFMVRVIGEGTNTIFGAGLEKTIIIKNVIKGISCFDEGETVLVTASSGENWDRFVVFTIDQGLWGLENCSLIPGSVGAAPVQNVGAYGRELSDVLVSLSALDVKTMNTVEISREACEFGYRDSLFKHEVGRYIITSVTVRLFKNSTPKLDYKPLDSLKGKDDVSLIDIRDLVVTTRKDKLPDYITYPNAGSFFKNPIITKEQSSALLSKFPEAPLLPQGDMYKVPAAWLIEHVASMKGVKDGDVGTWPKQPLVIVNYGEASLEDLGKFVGTIKQKILEKTGIFLENEVNCITGK